MSNAHARRRAKEADGRAQARWDHGDFARSSLFFQEAADLFEVDGDLSEAARSMIAAAKADYQAGEHEAGLARVDLARALAGRDGSDELAQQVEDEARAQWPVRTGEWTEVGTPTTIWLFFLALVWAALPALVLGVPVASALDRGGLQGLSLPPPEVSLALMIPGFVLWSMAATAFRRVASMFSERWVRVNGEGIAVRQPGLPRLRTFFLTWEVDEWELRWDQVRKYYPYYHSVNMVPVESCVRFELGDDEVREIQAMFFSQSTQELVEEISRAAG